MSNDKRQTILSFDELAQEIKKPSSLFDPACFFINEVGVIMESDEDGYGAKAEKLLREILNGESDSSKMVAYQYLTTAKQKMSKATEEAIFEFRRSCPHLADVCRPSPGRHGYQEASLKRANG